MSSFNGVNPSIMKLEVRYANMNQPPTRKVSGGAKFARALGSFLGPVASVAGFFFPPMFAVGAAAYGMKNMAQTSINRQQAFINAEQSAAPQPQQIQFVGYEGAGAPAHIQTASHGAIGGPVRNDEMMNVLFLRNQASEQMIHTDYLGR